MSVISRMRRERAIDGVKWPIDGPGWARIQERLGVTPDGTVGVATARAVMDVAGAPPSSDQCVVRVPVEADDHVPHDWHVPTVEEQRADPESYPGTPTGPGSEVFWVHCKRCGATIMVESGTPPSDWWKGWQGLYRDCLETQVHEVMES